MSGLKGKPISMQQIQTQIQKVRERNFAGVSFFFYESLWNMTGETPQQRQAGFQKIFPTSVAYPNLLAGWKP